MHVVETAQCNGTLSYRVKTSQLLLDLTVIEQHCTRSTASVTAVFDLLGVAADVLDLLGVAADVLAGWSLGSDVVVMKLDDHTRHVVAAGAVTRRVRRQAEVKHLHKHTPQP